MLRAVTLDYWDTIYAGTSSPERVACRQEALLGMLRDLGASISAPEFDTLYRESAVEAHRWWRDEHRGYSTADRIRWILARLGIGPAIDESHIARAAERVDQTLVQYPAPLLPGAREALVALRARFPLVIISDTGFASGRAQDQLLVQDGVYSLFAATVYSMDVGHAKPRAEIFRAALDALGMPPGDVLHVGDNERTDVGGALAIGMRAVRLDAVRSAGDSRAEHVARSLGALTDYLLLQ